MASKRNNRGFSRGGNAPKMTAEQYRTLIGEHEHIEHKALRHEVAKEFAQFAGRNNLRVYQCNQFLNPPQPPPLPIESNHTNKTFRRATSWPAHSIIQKAAHMLFHTLYQQSHALKYLQKISLPPEKIAVAQEVCVLMEHSSKYWRKVNHMKRKYQARYNARTRRYALQHAPWSLQMAMTLCDFHLDHIVDIVYQKELWCNEYDEIQQRERIETRQEDETETDSSDSEYEPYVLSDVQQEAEEAEDGSSDNPIGAKLVNRVADHMTVEELDAIKSKVKQQCDQPLEDLFANMLNDLPDNGKKIAFAENFEIDLESERENENEEEKAVFEINEDTEEEKKNLQMLYAKYPKIDENLIRQSFVQNNKEYQTTAFELDHMKSETDEFFAANNM